LVFKEPSTICIYFRSRPTWPYPFRAIYHGLKTRIDDFDVHWKAKQDAITVFNILPN